MNKETEMFKSYLLNKEFWDEHNVIAESLSNLSEVIKNSLDTEQTIISLLSKVQRGLTLIHNNEAIVTATHGVSTVKDYLDSLYKLEDVFVNMLEDD